MRIHCTILKSILHSVWHCYELNPQWNSNFFPLLQRVNRTYSGLFQSCLFKGVISPSLLQNQSWVLPITSLQHSSPVRLLSWVYSALIFSWLPASFQDILFGSWRLSLKDPIPQTLFSAFKLKKQNRHRVLLAQVAISHRQHVVLVHRTYNLTESNPSTLPT